MDADWEEWFALTQQNPINLTEKGRMRLIELESKLGVEGNEQTEGHLENY